MEAGDRLLLSDVTRRRVRGRVQRRFFGIEYG